MNNPINVLLIYRGDDMENNAFVDLTYVASYVGTVFVTMTITQFLKELPFIKKVPTKYLSFTIALFNIMICTYFLSGIPKLADVYIAVINAMLISTSSNGIFDFNKKIK